MPGSSWTSRLNESSSLRIGDELQISGHILDVRLFEEADAAGDAEGNIAPGQFQLQFQRVKMRAVKHRHLVQTRRPRRAVPARAARRTPPARRASSHVTSTGLARTFAPGVSSLVN